MRENDEVYLMSLWLIREAEYVMQDLHLLIGISFSHGHA
jgi:hypothetical protein